VDQWLETGKGEMDEEKRVEIYHQIQAQILEDAPWLFLFERSDVTGWKKEITGIYFQIPNVVNFNHARIQ
jgi:ABC-type transport system substrate-binding protein